MWKKIKEKKLLIAGCGMAGVGIVTILFNFVNILISTVTILSGLLCISAYGEKTI